MELMAKTHIALVQRAKQRYAKKLRSINDSGGKEAGASSTPTSDAAE